MQVFSQVLRPITTKPGIYIQLRIVLHECKGIFDRTPLRGHFGLKTWTKFVFFPLILVVSQVFRPIVTKLGICIQLSILIHERKGIFDRTLFRGHLWLKTQRKIAILPLMQVFSQVFGPIATKLCICIQLSVVLHESKGIIDRTPFRGHLGLKTQRKIYDFAVDSSFLLGFSTDCYQMQYMHSTNKSAS